MAEHGVPVRRVINAGGIPRKSDVLNQVYANALGTPILVPTADTSSLGSAIFAFLAAGAFSTVEEAQRALCPSYRTIEPDERGLAVSEELFGLFQTLYSSFGREDSAPVALGGMLARLGTIAAAPRRVS